MMRFNNNRRLHLVMVVEKYCVESSAVCDTAFPLTYSITLMTVVHVYEV